MKSPGKRWRKYWSSLSERVDRPLLFCRLRLPPAHALHLPHTPRSTGRKMNTGVAWCDNHRRGVFCGRCGKCSRFLLYICFLEILDKIYTRVTRKSCHICHKAVPISPQPAWLENGLRWATHTAPKWGSRSKPPTARSGAFHLFYGRIFTRRSRTRLHPQETHHRAFH